MEATSTRPSLLRSRLERFQFLRCNMPDKTWKKAERRVAGFFGSTRNPLSGSNSKHSQSDTLHPDLYIEIKYRKTHTTRTLWEDTQTKAKQEGKIPICALVESRRHGFLFVIHSDDLNRFIECGARFNVVKIEEDTPPRKRKVFKRIKRRS